MKDQPENSIKAFRAAHALGFRYLETDVQTTRDGVLVAFHDTNLKRTCGFDAEISSLSAEELSAFRIDGAEPIPLLDELFEEFPDAMINLDAKADETVEPLVAFLRGSRSLNRVCIGSFSHRRLKRIRRELGPDVCTSASPLEVSVWMSGIRPQGPSCLQIPLKQGLLPLVTQRNVDRAKRMGLPVHVWTLDDPALIQHAIDLGVDGIMTDTAHVLKSVAERNLIWS